jgi:hypothetical protein
VHTGISCRILSILDERKLVVTGISLARFACLKLTIVASRGITQAWH